MRMIFLNSQNHISMAASLQQFSILSWSGMWFPPNKLTPPHESPLPSLGWRKRPVPLGQASAEAVSGNLQIEWAEMSYHFIQIQRLKGWKLKHTTYHFILLSQAL